MILLENESCLVVRLSLETYSGILEALTLFHPVYTFGRVFVCRLQLLARRQMPKNLIEVWALVLLPSILELQYNRHPFFMYGS
jgi:hypothetical protein